MIIGNKQNKSNNNINNMPNQNNHYKDIMNPNEMRKESFQILEERYKNGLISIDEFTKKCNQLNKFKQNK